MNYDITRYIHERIDEEVQGIKSRERVLSKKGSLVEIKVLEDTDTIHPPHNYISSKAAFSDLHTIHDKLKPRSKSSCLLYCKSLFAIHANCPI